jgi:proteasome lid subunit RPN8/RPN11
MHVSLAPGLLEKMVEHAQACHPREACGLLIGHGSAAARFVPMDNVLAGESEFDMDPRQLAATFRSLRQAGEEIVAIFHSHPKGPAVPSSRDIERAYYPEAAHIIVSLAEPNHPQVRGFRIIDAEVIEIELHAIV